MDLNCTDINELIKNFIFLEHEFKVQGNEIDKLNTIIEYQERELNLLRDLLKGEKE